MIGSQILGSQFQFKKEITMEFVSLKDLRKIAEDYNGKLLSTDPRFKRSVTLIHMDGSFFHYSHAFLMQAGPTNSWVIVFTEHHGVHIYDIEDFRSFYQSERSHETLEELSP